MPFRRVSEALWFENLIGKPRAGAERPARGPFPPGPERAPLRSGRGNDANVPNSRAGGGPPEPATASGACKWTDVEDLCTYSATARRARAGIPRNRRFYVKSRPLPCRRARPAAGPPSSCASAGASRSHGGARRCAVAPVAGRDSHRSRRSRPTGSFDVHVPNSRID